MGVAHFRQLVPGRAGYLTRRRPYGDARGCDDTASAVISVLRLTSVRGANHVPVGYLATVWHLV